ncbi:hypothetical protein [Burkholderia ambifaria]|uniref:hypothetical protein n=1 Tax=Burkholderia ambifaria TaxID=152480 RepID=UPI00158C28F0|nr:hypothetical protein [Burkholderia ambifaria]MBR8347490.1 hypothetical protein [Burkholderia ambifaria]
MNKAQCQARRCAVAGVVLFGFLSGCSADKVTGPGALRDTWSTQFEQYGISAVFPPRADIQVGDIYLTCGSTIAEKNRTDQATETARRLVPNALWLASISGMLDNEPGKSGKAGYLSTEYRSRIQLPRIPIPTESGDTASTAGAASATSVANEPVAASAPADKKAVKVVHRSKSGTPAAALASSSEDQASQIFSSRPLSNIMPVSLPEFFSVSGTKAQAAAIVPLPTILANVGVNASAVDAVQISIPQAESYGLPAAVMLSMLTHWAQSNGGEGGIVSNIQHIIAPLRGGDEAAAYCPIGTPQLYVITEIYATRSIDVSMSFSNSAGLGGGVGLNLPTGSKNAAVWDALGKYFTPQSSTSGGNSGSGIGKSDSTGTTQAAVNTPTIDQATAFVKELNALYSKLGGDQTLSYPGGQVTVVTANSAGVSMNRKFEIPVVIGYRGIAMDLDVFDTVQEPTEKIAGRRGAKPVDGPTFNPAPVADAPLSTVNTGLLSNNATRTTGPVLLSIPVSAK